MDTEAPDLPAPDYYTGAGRKISDFCIGFFGALFIAAALFTVMAGLMDIFDSDAFVWLFSMASILLLIALIVLFFRVGRRYIAIGAITGIAAPFVVFGACLAVIFVAWNR